MKRFRRQPPDQPEPNKATIWLRGDLMARVRQASVLRQMRPSELLLHWITQRLDLEDQLRSGTALADHETTRKVLAGEIPEPEGVTVIVLTLDGEDHDRMLAAKEARGVEPGALALRWVQARLELDEQLRKPGLDEMTEDDVAWALGVTEESESGNDPGPG